MDTEERFWAKVEKQGDGCWGWTGYVDPAGYGRFHVEGEQRAHRWSYRRFIGPLDPARVIDHTCRNRRCVNPQHLRLLTSRQNTFAPGSIAPAKRLREADMCPRGHAWTPENTGRQKGSQRYCRTCARERNIRQRAERRTTICPFGHAKVARSDGDLYCPVCFAATRRHAAPPTLFGCGHERAVTGQANRRGVLYCVTCRSEKRRRPDSVRAGRNWRY